MDQFDRAFKKIQHSKCENEPTNILVLGTTTSTVESLRASLEVHGHTVSQAGSVATFEKLSCNQEFTIVFVSTDSDSVSVDSLFESISLLSPNAIVVGYSIEPNPETVIKYIRSGCADFFNVPADLDCIGDRLDLLIKKQLQDVELRERANYAMRLCDKMNEARHLAEEENDALNNQLANVHCETQKKMQQCAIGAEFQTLVNQELEVESMLRTALGYMLTRVGAMNATVYLREGAADWGIGAYINYDRQPEQFQTLVDTIGPAVCPTVSSEETVNRFVNGEIFANTVGLDPIEFSGNEVISFGCFSGDQCMAVVVLFRDESKPFTSVAMDTIETLRSIFAQQLDTIIKIHRRSETHWPSESIDDDEWTNDKAA